MRHQVVKALCTRAALGAGAALSASVWALAAQLDARALSAGVFTSREIGAGAYSVPAQVLNAEQVTQYQVGRESFQQRWVIAPSIGGPWGLGPTFNGDRCTACHEGNGRGAAPDHDKQAPRALLVRLSIPGVGEHGAPLPHPHYGTQLNDLSVPEVAPPEGGAVVSYAERHVTYADGETLNLRVPKLMFERLQFGELGEQTMTSARLAPPLVGLGLLEAIPEATILAIAQQQLAAGISGKPNYVWDVINARQALGRFGLKANQPSIRQQVAAAFHGDIGVTSAYFTQENCPEVQVACKKSPPGGLPELTTKTLAAIEFYLQASAVPLRRNTADETVLRGEALFKAAQCALCHVPELKTAEHYTPVPAAANQVVRAYTDLLLHDMGEELADRRADFAADGREWRTAPLWGLGLSGKVNGRANLLHDGRARSVAEAILWHGGEAHGAREAFRNMPRADREALIKFVESI